MTPLQQAILLNLYRQQTKKNGRIDLPTIETLVHNFRNSLPRKNPDNQPETTPIIPPNPPLEVNNNSPHLEVNNQPSVTISENTTNNLLIDSSIEPLNLSAHIPINHPSTNNLLIDSSIEPPTNEGKNNEIPRETVKMDAELNQAKPSENNQPSTHYKIEHNLEKIILELYLQEVAQQLVKPSKKALKSIFFPNINKFLKELNL